MPTRTRSLFQSVCLCALLAVVPACADTEPPTSTVVDIPFANGLGAEEEIFGDVYANGVPIANSVELYVTLERAGILGGVPVGPPIWVNPAGYPGGWMYGWYDRQASDGPCRADALDRSEQHLEYSEVPASGNETHCIDVGRSYVFRLYQGHPDAGGTLLKEYQIDYPKWVGFNVTNQHLGSSLLRERMEGAAGTWYLDAFASVDLTAGTGTDNPVLWIDTAGTSLGAEDDVFHDIANPTATTEQYFRFSAIGTSYTSAISDLRMRRPMAKLWILRDGNVVHETGHYTFHTSSPEFGLQRTLRFSDLGLPAGTYVVALEMMRPDEAPLAAPPLSPRRTIVVTEPPTPPTPPTACYSRESSSTWKRTTQTLDATCTTNEGSGATYQWRWTTNSSATAWSTWTSASTNPVFQFAGHPASGTQYVEMRVTAPNGTVSQSHSFSVTNSQVVITGQTLICAKSTYQYSSNVAGNWLEQFPPSTTWTTRATGSSTYTRVWSAGSYDVLLRQQVSTSPLARGQVLVQVRTTGGCFPES